LCSGSSFSSVWDYYGDVAGEEENSSAGGDYVSVASVTGVVRAVGAPVHGGVVLVALCELVEDVDYAVLGLGAEQMCVLREILSDGVASALRHLIFGDQIDHEALQK